jgi:hypothetical protein
VTCPQCYSKLSIKNFGFNKPRKQSFKSKQQIGILTTCTKCNYIWDYTGNASRYVICPKCHYHVGSGQSFVKNEHELPGRKITNKKETTQKDQPVVKIPPPRYPKLKTTCDIKTPSEIETLKHQFIKLENGHTEKNEIEQTINGILYSPTYED